MDYSHALKHAMDLATMLKTSQTINVLRTWKLLTRKLHSKLPSVQWSVYNNWFSFLFSTWISTRTPMKTSTTPENARFSGGWKEASFFFFFFRGERQERLLVGLIFSNKYFKEFHHVAGQTFLQLSFAFHCPGSQVSFAYIFYYISSKSINKPSLGLPYVSVSLQTLKQQFSRALLSKMQVQALVLHWKN